MQTLPAGRVRKPAKDGGAVHLLLLLDARGDADDAGGGNPGTSGCSKGSYINVRI